jgi:glycosyltransferase involved in cell wall biosynthesis
MTSLPFATLIAVYRQDDPALFRAALLSTLSQVVESHQQSRVYLGIDGPINEALERVVSEFEPQIFCIYRSEVNKGLAATLNALIVRLKDEAFVFRMDADDLSLPGRYAAQLAYLDAHPEVDILGTAITEADSASGQERLVRFARDHRDALASIHLRVPVAHATVCFRRRVFDLVQGYPERGTNEDIALWFKCLKAGLRFGNLPQSYLRFHISENFWKRRSLQKAFMELRCYLAGIHTLFGLFTWRYAAPFARFVIRLAPTAVSRWVYASPLRRRD